MRPHRIICALLTGVLLLPSLSACKNSDSPADTSGTGVNTVSTTASSVLTEKKQPSLPSPSLPDTLDTRNLSWPQGQIFPTFPSGSGELDVITDSNLTVDEKITFTCLQGLVNANETRLALYIDNVESWANIYGYKTNKVTTPNGRYNLIKKYTSEISGVVLYSAQQVKNCPDIVNLAATAANIRGAIPLSSSLYNRWKAQGIELPVVEDLTGLTLSTRLNVYQYLYDHYWQACTKRILIVQDARYHQLHDLASATGAAIVYLSCKTPEDRKELALFKNFCRDMTPGESIVMGWNGQEKELMTTLATYGLSCVPADYFSAVCFCARY